MDVSRLQPFTGKPGKNFDKFANKFNRLAQAIGWDAEENRKKLPYYLDDMISDYYNELSQQDRTSSDQTVTKLRATFCRGQADESAWQLLMTMKQ